MTSELSNITVTEGNQEEKKKIESWLSQPSGIIEILGKTKIEEVASDDEVANMNVINKGKVETIEGEVFSKSPSVADEKSEKYTVDSQMTSEDEKSKTHANSVRMEMDPETIWPYTDTEDMKNKHGSSLRNVPVEETSSQKAGPDVTECAEENISMPCKEASEEAVELTEKMKDSTSIEDEVPNKNLESSLVQEVEDELFHRVDNFEISEKQSESWMKDTAKESQYETENENKILENVATADSDQSETGIHDEIHGTVSFGQQRESRERESKDLTPTEVLKMKGRDDEDMGVTDEDDIVAEEQEKPETSTPEEQSGQSHKQKTERETPTDSKEIETEGSNKNAEMLTDIEDQRPVGSPEEIIAEKVKYETTIADDFDQEEIQEAKNLPTVDLDEKTRSAEPEIPNKSGSELCITHPPIEEGLQVGGEKQEEVSVSESGDAHTAIQKAGLDVAECAEEIISMPCKEASKETVELTEKMKDSTSIEDEVPNKNLESSFVQQVENELFHRVDNFEIPEKQSESWMKDMAKESHYEAENENEILENIAAADSNQSKTGIHDESHDTASFGQQWESRERESKDLTPTEVLKMKERNEEDTGVTDEDNIAAEEQEKPETSTHEEQSGQSHMQKTGQETPTDSKEIETEGSNKNAEMLTDIEEQRPVGSPEDIIAEKVKYETTIADDFDQEEIQEAKNLPTVDLDEKTRSAEPEIPNKSGRELCITHPPIEEGLQVGGEKQEEVSVSESGDAHTAIQKAGLDVAECAEENISMPCKEASKETVELTEKMKDLTSIEDEVPNKNLESSFVQQVENELFHRVDNFEIPEKQSESWMKDMAKESQYEAENENKILENIAAADSNQSKTGIHDESHDTASFGQQWESRERESKDLTPTEVLKMKERNEEDTGVTDEDNIAAEEQEKPETSTHEEQSGQSHMQKTGQETPTDSKEIEKEGSNKNAEMLTDIEEPRPVGSPEEIIGEKIKYKTIIADDFDKKEIQEAKNLPTVDLDEKTRSAESEIPNKIGGELCITHPPIEEEVQVGGEKHEEVSMSESGDAHAEIQNPNEEEKHVNETSEATKSPESTISEHAATEGALNIGVTSASEIDINIEKVCELKSEEAEKINAQENAEEERQQIEKASDAECSAERKSDDNERSTIEEGIPDTNRTPFCSGEEEYHRDQEEKLRSNSFQEEFTETDSRDQSDIPSNKTNNINEKIINQEVCEDPKIVDRGEDREKEMKNEENTVTDYSPEPTGECTTKCSQGNEMDAKKHKAEVSKLTSSEKASEGYDTYLASTTLSESDITDLASSSVQEEAEETLTEDRRDAMTSDKEVWGSNTECRELDFNATHSKEDRTAKDLKDEAEANAGFNTTGSSDEAAAQKEGNLSLVQNTSVPEIIEKEIKGAILDKEDSEYKGEAEETRLTEAEAEFPIQVDSSNLISEEEGQVTTETSEMWSNGIDVIAEPAEISILGDNKDMEIPTARKDGADEATETTTQPESKDETCDELSKSEDQRGVATVETSSDDITEQDLLEYSTMPLEADNLVTEVTEATGEAPGKDKALYAKEETPSVAQTTEECIAENKDESTNQENDTNTESIDIGKESTIDDAWVEDRELHAPLELNIGKSISESPVELLKGVNAGDVVNGSEIGQLKTSEDEKSSYIGIEKEEYEYADAVNEAAEGIEVGGGCIDTKNAIPEQEDSAKNFEGSSKEGVESEVHICGSEASETQTISTQTEKERDVDDKELTSELPNPTVNKVPLQEKKNTESWLSQPPETIEILEKECLQVAHNVEVDKVNVVDKENVETIEGEIFSQETSVADGRLTKNTEDDQLNTKEEMSGFQEEENPEIITHRNITMEASYGQNGVGIQTPEVTEGSSKNIEILNEVPNNEENMENVTSTETTSIEQDLKETSFEGEGKKSNTCSRSTGLEMDPEATQPSTDREDEKNKGEEMLCHGAKDVCIPNETASQDNHETNKLTESNVSAKDKLGSSLVTAPIEDLQENSRIACEDESQETGKLIEGKKDDASVEDEVPNQNLESSFFKKVENHEASKEESETGMKDINKETQKEEENQTESLENTTTSNLNTEGEDVEIPERIAHVSAMKPEDSMIRESEDVTPAEALTMECEPGVMVVPGEYYVGVEQQETTSKPDEHTDQSLNQNTEPEKANLGSPSAVAPEEFGTTSLNACTETITNIEEEKPVGSPEQILGEIADDINENEVKEVKNLSKVDVGEKTRSAEVTIPNNNGNEVYVTHTPVEELFPEGDENQNEVCILVSEEQERNETSKHEEHSEQSLMQNTETAKANLGSSSIVASEEYETTSHNEHAESIKKNEEEIPVGSTEEILGEARKDETMIADDLDSNEDRQAESLSAVDLDKKTRSADDKIPDNIGDEVYVTHPSVEETVLEGGQKKNEVSMLESADQVHEASASEVPKGAEKHANDSYEASKSPECKILEHTSTDRAFNTEVTSTRSVSGIPVGSQEEILGETRKDETMIVDDINNKDIQVAENLSTVDFHVTPPSGEETFLEGSENKNDVPMLEPGDKVHEASEVPREEEKQANDMYEASKNPESNILEYTSTQGALQMEVISPRSAMEKAADADFQISTKSDNNENRTIKEESPVKNNTPTCTREEQYHHDQEEVTSNSYKEASPTLDSGEHSCSTSDDISDQIMNEEAIQVHEDPKIADRGEDTEDSVKNEAHTVADHSPEPTGEHTRKCSQENETEASNVYGPTPTSTTTEEYSITELPSSFIREEKVEERLKEDKGDEIKSEKEVSNSNVECIEQAFDAARSTEEREGRALKHEAESNEDLNAENIKESSSEEITQKERNLDLVENSSSVPEIGEKEIKKEVFEKEDSNVPLVAEETSLIEVEGKDTMGVDCSNLVFEEKDLVTTETSEMGSNSIDLIAKTVETSILGENNNMEIPTAGKNVADEPPEKAEPEGNNQIFSTSSKSKDQIEVATFETSLDEQMLQASSTLPLEEHNPRSPDVDGTRGETPEKGKTLYDKADTPLVAETTEDETREIKDASSNPTKDTTMRSIDIRKERENDYALVEDQEFYVPPEQNIEKRTSESDVELLKRVNTNEVADCSDISQSETVEELKSSENSKSEHETVTNETSEGVDICFGCMDTEKAILEQEDSGKNLEGSSKESDEIEKAPVEFAVETRGSETSETKSISTPKEKNINIVEHDETEDNRRFPETKPENAEEESHDEENQTIDLLDRQIKGQEIREGKKEMNEEMEPTLETQNETNGTEDAILTEKVSMKIESAYESETIKEQITEEESCTKELYKLPVADETLKEVTDPDLTPIKSLDATASDKSAEMMESKIAEDLNIESEATQKEINETQDAFSTEKVSTGSVSDSAIRIAEITEENCSKELHNIQEVDETVNEVTYLDLTAIQNLEATASAKNAEMMEPKIAQDLNEESEASPMGEILEDEIKNIETPMDVSSLVSENLEEKMKGGKIEDTESCDDETDISPPVETNLTSLGEVQLNDEHVKALDTSSDAESIQTTKTADASQQELEETSIMVSQLQIHEHENAENANIPVDKTDVNDVEVEATEIPDSLPQTEDQAVKEIHEAVTSLNVIDADPNETETQIREVPQVPLESTNQHGDAARDYEITPGQTDRAEKIEEQLRVPSSVLISKEQESETTTVIEKGSTDKDHNEEARIRQAEIGEELETTSAEELGAERSKDSSRITKMSTQEVVETNLGGQDTDELVKSLTTSSDTGSRQTTETPDACQQGLEETSSMMSQFPVNEHEKSENLTANEDQSDAYDVEVKEFEISGAVPEPTDQRVQEIHETNTSLPEEESHTNEIKNQIREAPEAFSEAINHRVEAVSEDEIITSVVAREVTSLGEVQHNENVEAHDTHSSAKHLDMIKTADASQQDAELKNMKLEETYIMVSQLPIHEREEADNENIQVEKSEAIDVEVEETKFPDTVPESEDQAAKEIHEIGTSLNVVDADTNEIQKPIREVPQALSESINKCVDATRDDQSTSSQTLRDQKLEEQLQAPSSNFLSKEQESETTTTNEKGTTEKDGIEGTKILQAEVSTIREELQTTSEGKEIENQVQEEEKRVQDWSTVCSAEELDTKSSKDNAMIAKTSREEVPETNHGADDTDEHVKALDTSSDNESLQTLRTPDATQEELEETSSMVSKLPVHKYEKMDNKGVNVEKSDAYDVEVKQTKLPGVVPKSEDQRIKEVHEVTSVEETQTNEMETQIREVHEALSEDINQGVVSEDDIIGASVATKVASLGELPLNDEHVEAPDTIKSASANQQDPEFDSMKRQETSIMVSQLPMHEHEKAESENIPVEKSDASNVEVAETEIPETLPESEDQAVKEIHETGPSLTEGAAETNEREKEIRGVPEALSESINPCFDASRDDEMTPVQTLRAEEVEEQLQVPPSILLSKEEDGETSAAIKQGSTDKDGTEVGKLRLQENSGTVLQLQINESNSAKYVIEEKSGTNEVELNETKTLGVVSKSEDQGFEAIREIRTSPAAENAETDKREEEIKEVTEKIVDLRYQGVDAETDGENLDHPLPVGKLDEQIQLSSSSYESTKEDETELSKSDLEEAADAVSKFPTTEREILHVGETIEKTEADEVQDEEAKTSEAISESKSDDVEEIKEIGSSPPLENTPADKIKEETKAVPETLFEPTQGAETAIDGEIAIDQTLTTQRVEQLQEPKSTTEKPCLQDEEKRELEVSNLELKLQEDGQDRSPEEDNTGLEKGLTDAPSEYEERPIQDSSQEASIDEDIFSNNSNKDADNLPPPYPTVAELSTEDISGKCEEACNLEFGKNGKVLPESVSAINSHELPLTSEGIVLIEEHPKEATTEPEDSKNHCAETTEEEAIEKYTSKEKVSEEMQGARNFDPIYLQEDAATKPIQEYELRAEDYPGERTDIIGAEDGTEVGKLKLQDNSGTVFQLQINESNSAKDVIEEKSDADEVELNETKTLDLVSESEDQGFEAIHEIRTSSAAENAETDKREEDVKEVTEKIVDLRYQGVDAETDGENLDHPLPVGKLEEQIHLSSSSYESTKEDETELSKSDLEEAADAVSKFPTTEREILHVGATIEKTEADEVQVEEAETSEAISGSKSDDVEEIKEIGSSPPLGNTPADKVKEETKAVPETILEHTQGAETAIDGEIAIDQTLTTQGVEQLQEPKSTTEKPCLQDEGNRDLEVFNLELQVQKDGQDRSPEEDNTGLEKGLTDAPSEYEERPIQDSPQEASIDEDVIFSNNPNKDADNLPPPYPTVAELSTEDVSGKGEEACNLEFEKNGKVLPESVSAINSHELPLTSEGIVLIEEHPKEASTELEDSKNHGAETAEEEAIEKYTSKEKVLEEMQGAQNFDPISLQEDAATKLIQEDELRAEDYPGERTDIIFEAPRNETQYEKVFEESEDTGVDKVTVDDKAPYQVSVGHEILTVTPPEEAKDGQNIQKAPNQSELKSHCDETDVTGTATDAPETTARIKELKSSEVMLVSHEEEITGYNDEETVINKDRQLQKTDLAVPQVTYAAAEEAPEGKEVETFDDFSEPALKGPTHGIIEPYEHEKETATAGTINSESLMDNEKLGNTFLEPECEGSGGTEDLDLNKKDGTNKPSTSSTTATSQKDGDTKQHDFTSDKPTAEAVNIREEGNSLQLEEHTKDKESVERSTSREERKLDEAKSQTITAIEEEETQEENEKPIVLPHINDSEKQLSREEVIMNISEDTQGLEKTSLAVPQEEIASKTDPSESIERTNPTAMQDDATAKTVQDVEVENVKAGHALGSETEAKGMERGEESRMGEESKEITEESPVIESAKMSLSDFMQRSTERNLQAVEDLTEERELMGNKEEPKNATAETVQAEEAGMHEKKDEEEEGDEQKRDDSGSDAPVMVEASRDMDVKIAHKKSHHYLSGVGSKVKHSLAKVKKAITGKSSHPKTTSPK